ncbi:DNA polymerase eta-like [Saccostrea echinata]|uniref:DNA polymerase eta-like n=1 Tax=Saccostrea echinata TaxID=191078 RepID=UPI002A7F09C9|nr:DNA polymerase eta-like [Saccostrea echinata]
MERVIALVDMDCFYVQVEQRQHPETKGLPCAVVQYKKWKGGGIIAVGYEARAKGVTRNMWGDDAKAKCPNIHFFRVPEVRGKADLTKFREAGAEVIAVLSKFSDCVERASIDEAYIDLTEEVKKRMASTKTQDVSMEQLPNTFIVGWGDDKDGSKRKQGVDDWIKLLPYNSSNDSSDQKLLIGALIAEEMRAAVYKETGFRCSAGIAHNKMLAKLVCGLHKPNKQTILPQSSVQQLFDTLPINKIRNLGGKLGQSVMEQLSIEKMGELCQFELHTLQQNFGDKTGAWLYEVCRGVEHEPVSARQLPKSIGCSKNFPGKTCLDTKDKVKFWLLELSKEVEERLIKDKELNNRVAKSMTVSVRYMSNPSPIVASRACAVTKYDAEKFANDAYALILKLNHAPAHQSAWSPPILCLGVSATKFLDESNNQSTLSFFVGQKTLGSISASQSEATPPKSETKTIASFFRRGKDCSVITSSQNDSTRDQQNSITHEQGDSSSKSTHPKKQSQENKNFDEGNVLDLPEKDLTLKKSDVTSEQLIDNEKNHSPHRFFATRKLKNDLVHNLPKDSTPVGTQDRKRSNFEHMSEMNSVEDASIDNKISQNSVDPDFIAALPPEIREEVLSQVSSVPAPPVDNQCKEYLVQKQKDRTSLEKFLNKQDSSVSNLENSEEAGKNLAICEKCNKQIEKSEMTEHLDYHFAKELQKELSWTSDKNSGQSAQSSGQRKRSLGCSGKSPKKVMKKLKNNAGLTQTISHFFK